MHDNVGGFSISERIPQRSDHTMNDSNSSTHFNSFLWNTSEDDVSTDVAAVSGSGFDRTMASSVVDGFKTACVEDE